ncbi:P-loop NTPase fold protein [Azospirillum argentinense]|uniref:Restriction endonuclease n=1 Tax=Azospirillum brasilense TaxID=192 RepID=A0A4D8PYQ6_AZOBR|nr:P-loop NTPase fold protein [Azospirillum argentinense]QCO00616.1 hypothetical protein D3867_00090 [Azospirillum argentinense]
MAENFDVGHAAPAALTGFAFESAVLEMFRRIRGIDVSTTGSRHDGGVDLIIADGTPIGIPGPVNVQVKFVKRRRVGLATVENIAASMLSINGVWNCLLITNGSFTEDARSNAYSNIFLWGAVEIDQLLKRFPAAADPIRPFLKLDNGVPTTFASHRPTVSVVRTDKGWNLHADAFVLPLGMGGQLTGSTYRALASDQDDQEKFNRILEAAIPVGFGPSSPIVLMRKTGNIDYLLLATAYGKERKIVPGEALEAILSIPNTFRRIVLPLLGAAQLHVAQVLNEFYTVISSTQLATPLHITLVVVDLNAEALAKQRFIGFEEPSSVIFPPSQPHFTNDAVNGHNAKDCLGIEAEARTFARLLASRNVTLPLAIGLFGNWGSGKSFFMKLIHQQMESIATEEGAAETKVYCTNIAHITFNAWHYLDSNLWASLALRIFEGVAAQLSDSKPEEPPTREAAKTRRALAEKIESSRRARIEAEEAIAVAEQARRACEDRIAELQSKREEVTRGLSLSDVRLLKPEVMSAINTLGLGKVEDFEKLEKSLKEGQAVLESLSALLPGPVRQLPGALRIAVVLGFGLLVGEAVLKWLPDLTRDYLSPISVWMVTATAIGSWTVKRLTSARDAVKTLSEAVARVRKAGAGNAEANAASTAITELRSIDLEIATKRQIAAAAEKDLADAAARLQKVESGTLVYEFLTERSADRHYSEGTGIVSVLRQDLERLKDKLNELNVGSERKVERIVLYIDDLDRCDPARVVEVLQAVHLLLAFDLFGVVVAVDARWLERSLYVRYLPGFEKMTEDARAASEFSPQNYLEKIFQVPYYVPGMGPDGFGKLIDALTPREAPVPMVGPLAGC